MQSAGQATIYQWIICQKPNQSNSCIKLASQLSDSKKLILSCIIGI